MGEENRTRDVIDAVTGIAKAVPIYEDLLQPTVKEVGSAICTLTHSINVALKPLATLIWSFEKIFDKVQYKLEEKLAHVPRERIITPEPEIAVPVLEGLRYLGHNKPLFDLFMNLLATSMDGETAKNAHPGFVEVIKNLSPDEANIMKLFSKKVDFPLIDLGGVVKRNGQNVYKSMVVNYSNLGFEGKCKHPELAQAYIDNLCRLHLVKISKEYLHGNGIYEPLEQEMDLFEYKSKLERDGFEINFRRKRLSLTNWGSQFLKACDLLK